MLKWEVYLDEVKQIAIENEVTALNPRWLPYLFSENFACDNN
jgi:hypothetical protein